MSRRRRNWLSVATGAIAVFILYDLYRATTRRLGFRGAGEAPPTM
jgi:hypothetical protein